MDLAIAFMLACKKEKLDRLFFVGEQSLTVFSIMLEAYLEVLKKNPRVSLAQIQAAKILNNGIYAYYEAQYEEEYRQNIIDTDKRT